MNTLSIADLLSQLKNVKPNGKGYTALCPCHEDKKNSLSIAEDNGKILIHCFAGCSTDDICESIGIDVKDLFIDSFKTSGKKIIDCIYDYQAIDGSIVYQNVRFKPKDFRHRRPNPENPKSWIWGLSTGDYYKSKYNEDYYLASRNKQLPTTHKIHLKSIKPMPYRLPKIADAAKNNRNIFIVDGEKDVATLESLNLIATTNKFDISYGHFFAGAKVAIVPDNDKLNPKTGKRAGTEQALKVANMLYGSAKEIRIVYLPEGIKDLTAYFKLGYKKEEFASLIKATEPFTPTESEPPPEPEPIKPGQTLSINMPFRLIGYNDGCHYYLPHEDLQIIRLSPDQHTQSALINLAPLQWWETNFPSKTGPDYNAAKNWLFRASKSVGIYDTRRLRGCGTWFDDGRVVQHFGDRLIVDGKETEIQSLKTNFIYNASYPVEIERASPLELNKSHKFLEICRMPSWEKQIYGTLLAGWCVVAPICGALTWRPHIWVSGASGTGKSWIIDEIIKSVIGDIKLQAQSNSTEAGIRQALGINAFPVLFDEAEGEDANARLRLQGIIDLMRQSSSETGAPIIKGTQGGRAMIFHIRSCFMLASIGVNVDHKADKSRISILSLTRPNPKDTIDLFDNLKEEVKIMSPQWCASLRARTLIMIPVILENALTFGRAIACKFNDQRIGDQLGILLSGAYSLTSDNAITEKKASEWIDAQNWDGESCVDDESDERICLNNILSHILSYTVDNQRVEKSIARILYQKPITAYSEEALEQIGIRVIKDSIVISDSHSSLKSILKNTPFEKNWSKYLRRLPEIEQKAGVKYNGIINRATAIPYDIVFQNDKNET